MFDIVLVISFVYTTTLFFIPSIITSLLDVIDTISLFEETPPLLICLRTSSFP